MFNRKQISQLQYSAGDRYRHAYDMTLASPGGSMDFDRARGGSGLAPVSPPLTYLLAAECVSQARLKLYPKDYAVVHRVCAQGFTVEQAAKQLFDERYDGSLGVHVRNIGRRLGEGLEMLADMWWPDSKIKVNPKTGDEVRPMRSMMTERAKSSDAEAVPASSHVVHATRDKVYRSNDKRRERA